MLHLVYETFRKSIFSPKSLFEGSSPLLKHSLIFYFTLLLSPFGLLTSYVIMLALGVVESLGLDFITSMITGILFNVFSLAFYTFLLHVIVMVFKGKGGIESTIMVNCIASGPYLAVGFIPLLNVIAMMYGIYINAIGIQIMHKLSLRMTLLAVFVSSISFIYIPFAMLYYG